MSQQIQTCPDILGEGHHKSLLLELRHIAYSYFEEQLFCAIMRGSSVQEERRIIRDGYFQYSIDWKIRYRWRTMKVILKQRGMPTMNLKVADLTKSVMCNSNLAQDQLLKNQSQDEEHHILADK